MEYSNTIFLMEKRGNLKGFSEEDKIKFISLCNSNFLFYDPYKDVLINPIKSKKYWPKTLQNLYLNSPKTLLKKITIDLPDNNDFEITLNRLEKQRALAYILQLLINKLKYLGIIIGILICFFINVFLGISVGLFLIYLDYNIYDKVNRVIGQIEFVSMSATNWAQNSTLYLLITLFFLGSSLMAFYLFINSLWIILMILVFQKFLIINPIVQYITSTNYQASQIASQLNEELKEQFLKFEFLSQNPNGIKINNIDYVTDKICYFNEIEDYKINLTTEDNSNYNLYLIAYSKQPIHKNIIDKLMRTEHLSDNLKRLISNINVDFFYTPIFEKNKDSYVVISKESYMSIYKFEGDYSFNTLRSYHIKSNKIHDYVEYKNGIRNGNCREYYLNGELYFECKYKNGILEPGNFIWYYENKEIMMEGSLFNNSNTNLDNKDLYSPNSNKRIGIWSLYNEIGELIKSVEYFPDGNKKIIIINQEEAKRQTWL